MSQIASLEPLGTLVAALLTIMVLSYWIGDNVLFRIAVHSFVGVSAGYAGSIAVHNVLIPRLVDPVLTRGAAAFDSLLIVPWLLVILLSLKAWRTAAAPASIPVALMVGVGAALVVGGAITGTLIPQSVAAVDTLDPGAVTPLTGETGLERMANVLIMIVGTVSTLVYFRFTARKDATGEATRSPLATWVSYVGRLFIALTFGVMYAGGLTSAIAVLAERVQFLIGLVFGFMGG
jgi:hypothetical protein